MLTRFEVTLTGKASQMIMKDPKVILMIDDEPEYMDGLVDVLNIAGYKTILESDLHVAIEYLRQPRLNIDLILLDLLMPPMHIKVPNDTGELTDPRYTGVRFYHYIRDQLGLKSIPIIVFSVVNDENIHQEIAKYELDKFNRQLLSFRKPTDPDEIIEAINNCLKQSE